jgi:hypothetical protein
MSEQPTEPVKFQNNVGDWGCLYGEPCRFCRRTGGVMFLVDNQDSDRQPVRCDLCGRCWEADSANA